MVHPRFRKGGDFFDRDFAAKKKSGQSVLLFVRVNLVGGRWQGEYLPSDERCGFDPMEFGVGFWRQLWGECALKSPDPSGGFFIAF